MTAADSITMGWDAEDATYYVYDLDGSIIGGSDDCKEAMAMAETEQARVDAEQAEEQAQELRDQVASEIDHMDDDEIKELAAFMLAMQLRKRGG